MTTVRVPPGLGVKGTRLWRELHKDNEFNPADAVLVEEACRIADRLDKLNALLIGEEDAWLRLRVNDDGTEVTVRIDDALSEARQQANVLKQICAALRLPDASGKKPQARGGARGAYAPSGKLGGTTARPARAVGGSVTALESARAARGG